MTRVSCPGRVPRAAGPRAPVRGPRLRPVQPGDRVGQPRGLGRVHREARHLLLVRISSYLEAHTLIPNIRVQVHHRVRDHPTARGAEGLRGGPPLLLRGAGVVPLR